LYHKLATATPSTAIDVNHNEWNCVTLAPAAQNELTDEAIKSKRHARYSALLMKWKEFYVYTGHETPLKHA
jgi:hypothetical protein